MRANGGVGWAARAVVGIVAVGALAAAALAPRSTDATDPAGGTDQWLPVLSSTLVCPEISVPDGSASIVSGMVAAVPGSVAAPGGSTASLQMLNAGQDLARITAPGDPVNLLVWRRSTSPIALTASGKDAGSTLAGLVTRQLSGDSAGLSSTQCAAPRSDWWFVGTSSQADRNAALLLENASDEPASLDLALFGPGGPVEALAGKGITLGPRSDVRLRLDALAQGQALLTVHVHATTGRVSASVRDVSDSAQERPGGVDYLPPAAPAARQQWITGVPGRLQQRTLVVVNPGSTFVTVDVRRMTAAGTGAVPGLTGLAVPAGSTVSFPLDAELGQAGGTLRLDADGPVTAAVKVAAGTTAATDVTWLSATPPVQAPASMAGAAAVAGGTGVATSVTVAAPQGQVRGVLEVIASGPGSAAVLGEGGALESGTLTRDREARSDTVGPQVLTDESVLVSTTPVVVSAGTQTVIDVPSASGSILHLVWHSGAGSAPALVSHLTSGAKPVQLTGYPWWPVTSFVPAQSVRDDIGTLVPNE